MRRTLTSPIRRPIAAVLLFALAPVALVCLSTAEAFGQG
jgi:hypothetical protein